MSEKEKFYEEMARGYEVENENEVLICLGDFNGHIGKEVDGFEGVYRGFGIGKRNLEGRLLLEFFVEKGMRVGLRRRILLMEGEREAEEVFEER